ncbi:glycoside hydrolase family 25 protein [Angustibacter sp. McL0619]|uniref:glycoside hydrolase family 25 protein n=1 Tax=Angustibacter sp. McL0619 TaxID=3415676 RepID=UPI003CE8DD3E
MTATFRPVRRAHILSSMLAGLALALGLLAAQPAPAASAAVRPRPAGIDVSRWQSAGPADTCATGGIDWAKVSRTSRTFVFIRATRTSGMKTSRDACFARNRAGARARGLYRGAYHYAMPRKTAGSAVRDARAFVAVTGGMQGAGDLPPVLDLEASGGLKPTQLASWAHTWLTTVRALTGRQPMIYTSPSFWRSAMDDSTAFHAYPLWIAHWTSGAPSLPGKWPTYAVHQYSASGRVSGIGTDVDLNVFNGSASQLAAFAHPATHPTVVTTGPTAYRGSPWQVSGRLTRAGGVPLTDTSVTLYRQVGLGPWTAVAKTRTSAVTAAYRFVLRPTTAARYRVRFSGSTRFAASWSYQRSHTIRNRVVTGTELVTDVSRVRKGGTVHLSGRLLRANGTPLTRRHVVVYQRVGTGRWTAVRTVTTSASAARFSLTVHPTRATSYQAVFGGSLSILPSRSAARTVRLR